MSDEKHSVTVSLGITLPVGDLGFVKPEIRLNNIDPDGDVSAQIARGLEIASQAFVAIDGQLEVVISDIVAPSTGKPGFREKLDKVASDLQTVNKNVGGLATALKKTNALVAALTARIEADGNSDENTEG